ncbi:MAG TPA: hypothetical protein VFQ91_22215, partial [Bryobacteraceae bacterium]|nr:hypothetical protein [Bryobacteraceae bacterium]
MFELSSISGRRAVWIAQSDLFLDTDTRLSYPYIARVAAESPFSLDELAAIFRDEVAPIAEPNLLDIAGEWAGFPEDWLVQSIAGRLERMPGPYRFLTNAGAQWEAVAYLVSRLRGLPPEKREGRWTAWK